MNLTKTNLFFGYLHIISALVLSILFYLHRDTTGLKTDIYRYQITGVLPDGSDVVMTPKQEYDVTTQTIEILLVLMFCVAGLFHLICFYSKTYLNDVKKGCNRLRWLEYSVTAAIIYFVLALFAGLRDINAIIFGTFLSSLLMGVGFFIERNKTKSDKITGLIIGFAIVAIMFGLIYNNLIDGDEDCSKVREVIPTLPEFPDWAKGVLIGSGILFLCLMMLITLYVGGYGKNGFDYLTYEKLFIYLSFLTKAYVGYYTTYGILK